MTVDELINMTVAVGADVPVTPNNDGLSLDEEFVPGGGTESLLKILEAKVSPNALKRIRESWKSLDYLHAAPKEE
jgi:hypothetical protein